jgi:hypothetical protein
MRLKLVRQEEKCGCSIACIAMITGQSYSAVRQQWHHDFSADGIDIDKTKEFLRHRGFALVHKVARDVGHIDKVRQEMLRPFAPVHLVRILTKFDSFGHLVVMAEDGTLLCPDGNSDEVTRNAYSVTDCVGLFR